MNQFFVFAVLLIFIFFLFRPDAQIRRQLQPDAVAELMIVRPELPPPYLAHDRPENVPALFDTADDTIPVEWKRIFERHHVIPVSAEVPVEEQPLPEEYPGEYGAPELGGEGWGPEEEARAAEADLTGVSLESIDRDRRSRLFVEPSGGEEPLERKRGVEIVSHMETPELEVEPSQFDIPIEQVSEEEEARARRPTIERRAVNRHTEIFRGELEKKFSKLTPVRGKVPQVEFNLFMTELIGPTGGTRDRALAFFQLLVLTSLDITKVKQTEPYGEIIITKGPKWNVRWR
jgi:hypothetical protein